MAVHRSPGVRKATRAAMPLIRALTLVLLATAAAGADLPADHAEKMARGLELFRKEVGPLLQEHCVKCHGGEKTKGEFDLATREGLLRGGKEGEDEIVISATCCDPKEITIQRTLDYFTK